MKFVIAILVGFPLLGAHGQTLHNVTFRPLDFQNYARENGDPFFSGVDILAAVGDKVYLSNDQEPYIAEIDLAAERVRLIGARGVGPGEFPRSVGGFAVDGSHLWAFDANNQKKLMHFVEGKHRKTMPIQPRGLFSVTASPVFAVHDGTVVLPLTPRTRRLGMAYHADGSQTQIGAIPFDESWEELLRKNPAMNATQWAHGDSHWFATFPYFPQILKFNAAFELVATFDIKHPYVMDGWNAVLEFQPKRPTHRPNTIITDFKFFRGRLYVLAQLFLYQIHPGTGEILSATQFFGMPPEFEERSRRAFNRFAFLENNTLLLGHDIMMGDYELWQVKNAPFLADPVTGSDGE
jgi:hypothetical protein